MLHQLLSVATWPIEHVTSPTLYQFVRSQLLTTALSVSVPRSNVCPHRKIQAFKLAILCTLLLLHPHVSNLVFFPAITPNPHPFNHTSSSSHHQPSDISHQTPFPSFFNCMDGLRSGLSSSLSLREVLATKRKCHSVQLLVSA